MNEVGPTLSMNASPQTQSKHDPKAWLLAFCPVCEYSLMGLPEVGICPECGKEYDQQFVVVGARPSRELDFSRRKSVLVFSLYCVGLIAIACFLVSQHDMSFLLGYVIVVIAMCWQGARNRAGATVRLWMSADGFEIAHASTTDLRIYFIGTSMSTFAFPLGLLISNLIAGKVTQFLVFGTAWLAIMTIWFLVWLFQRRCDRRLVIKTRNGLTRRLIPWRLPLAITVNDEPNGRTRVKIQMPKPTWSTQYSYPLRLREFDLDLSACDKVVFENRLKEHRSS